MSASPHKFIVGYVKSFESIIGIQTSLQKEIDPNMYVVWYISHYCLFPSHPFCPNITLATAYCMKEFALVGFLEFDNYTIKILFITKIHPFIIFCFFFLGKTISKLPSHQILHIGVNILKKIDEIN